MNLAHNVEARVLQTGRHNGCTDADESENYKDILEEVVKEDEGALAFGDIRIGDIILLVDCDTRVPEDCLLDAAIEFSELHDLAILQHKSSSMQVAHNYWESGILYFTQLIYAATTYVAAAGKMGPFLGYISFLDLSPTLGTTPLFVGHHYKKCHGFKTAK